MLYTHKETDRTKGYDRHVVQESFSNIYLFYWTQIFVLVHTQQVDHESVVWIPFSHKEGSVRLPKIPLSKNVRIFSFLQ